MSALPPGFTLDEESNGLPKGFTLDERRAPAKPKEGWDAAKDKLSRAGSGFMDPIVGAAQIADRFLVDPIRQAVSPGASSMKDVVRARDAEYQAPEGVDWMRMAGNVANPVSWAMPGGGAATTIPRMMAQGAMQSALAPTAADDTTGAFLLKKAGQAAMGGALAGVTGKLTKGLARPTADAEALIQQGVHVPPGAAMGGHAAKLEERLASMPLAGGSIDASRRRAVQDVQSRAIERAVGPGVHTVDDANRAASAMYQRAVPTMQANPEGLFRAAQTYNDALANPELTDAHRKILTGLWDKNFSNYANLSGEGLKKLDSELGFLGRKYSAYGGSPADQTLADELYNIMGAMREGIELGMPQTEARVLRQANRAYRGMVPINKAASARADQLATPRALQKALAKQARTDVTRMPPDALLDPATAVLTANVPDSGTAGRWASMSPLSWLEGALAAGPMAVGQSRGGARAILGQTDWQRAADPYANQTLQALIAALRE